MGYGNVADLERRIEEARKRHEELVAAIKRNKATLDSLFTKLLTLKKEMDGLRKLKKGRPPLFGLMHYERCRLVLQPLSSFGGDGPDYLTISKDNVNKAALLKAMSFT